jgi:putative endonuclease
MTKKRLLMNGNFHYVYIINSLADSDRYYVGITEDLEARLKQHNAGKCVHTKIYKLWQIETTLAFRSKAKAVAFEKYLKSHSGRAFAKMHL